jgi:Domain of unknown function (DUF4129)
VTHPGPITRLGAQQDARRELAKGIYHRSSDPLVVRAVRDFGHLVDRVLAKFNGAGTGSDLGALAIVAVLLAVVAIVIWRVGPPRRAAGATGAVLAGTRLTTAEEHRGRSEQAAAEGDWPTAVVERMRAIARELEERGVLIPRPGRTATELAREAGALLPAAQAAIDAAASTFNDVAYGGGPAGRDRLTVMAAADEQVRAGARSVVAAR